jgi:hypothetical protein
MITIRIKIKKNYIVNFIKEYFVFSDI